MITIYHNTRCQKSREGLEIIQASGRDYEIREYLKDPLSEEEIKKLLKKLGMAPMELIRTDEKLCDAELIQVMQQNPRLIQRPIVETQEKAVVGRPASNISDLIS